MPRDTSLSHSNFPAWQNINLLTLDTITGTESTISSSPNTITSELLSIRSSVAHSMSTCNKNEKNTHIRKLKRIYGILNYLFTALFHSPSDCGESNRMTVTIQSSYLTPPCPWGESNRMTVTLPSSYLTPPRTMGGVK